MFSGFINRYLEYISTGKLSVNNHTYTRNAQSEGNNEYLEEIPDYKEKRKGLHS
jgi:hypothetical protein